MQAMTAFRRCIAVAILAMTLLTSGSVALAQGSPGSPAPSTAADAGTPEPRFTLAPNGKAVKVGSGSVYAGQTAQRSEIALDDVELAAAREALAGKSIAIHLPRTTGGGEPKESARPSAAKAAIEALGAEAVFCETIQYRKRDARCDGRTTVDAIIGLPILPDTEVRPPGRLVKRGLVVVNVEPLAHPGGGTLAIEHDLVEVGRTQGRAAGAWAAAQWPDQAMKVFVAPRGTGDDATAFIEAVSQGVRESLPDAEFVPESGDPWTAANLYTGGLQAFSLTPRLAEDTLGLPGESVAVFGLSCLEAEMVGLSGDPRWAGCIDFMREDMMTTAVEAAARVLMGEAVPAVIVAAHQARVSE